MSSIFSFFFLSPPKYFPPPPNLSPVKKPYPFFFLTGFLLLQIWCFIFLEHVKVKPVSASQPSITSNGASVNSTPSPLQNKDRHLSRIYDSTTWETNIVTLFWLGTKEPLFNITFDFSHNMFYLLLSVLFSHSLSLFFFFFFFFFFIFNLILGFLHFIFLFWEFFTPMLVDGFSLESEWQQISKSPELFSVFW